MWTAGQRANKAIFEAFQQEYSSAPQDLNVGIVQFSTEVRTEQPITNNATVVLSKLETMPQLRELTYFDKALQACQDAIDADRLQQKSFDICVLITDGIDMSKKNNSALKATLRDGTAVFGIYVGRYRLGIEKLKGLVDCGLASKRSNLRKSKECNFFASASDYESLASRTHDIASEVTHGVDLATCAGVSALIGLPVALCMCLPYFLWYCSCTCLAMWRRRSTRSSRTWSSNNSNNGGNAKHILDGD